MGCSGRFVFGDSYSDTGYDAVNGLLLQPGIGQTCSGGLVWAQYLQDDFKKLAPNSMLVNFARAGATTSQSYVQSTATSIEDQVAQWLSVFPNEQLPWEAATSLFTVFAGINVSNSQSSRASKLTVTRDAGYWVSSSTGNSGTLDSQHSRHVCVFDYKTLRRRSKELSSHQRTTFGSQSTDERYSAG